MSKTKSNGKATKSEPSDLDTIRDTVEQAGYSRPVWPMGNYTLPTPFRAFTAAAQGERQLFKIRLVIHRAQAMITSLGDQIERLCLSVDDDRFADALAELKEDERAKVEKLLARRQTLQAQMLELHQEENEAMDAYIGNLVIVRRVATVLLTTEPLGERKKPE
jgi:hypothetical protein